MFLGVAAAAETARQHEAMKAFGAVQTPATSQTATAPGGFKNEGECRAAMKAIKGNPGECKELSYPAQG